MDDIEPDTLAGAPPRIGLLVCRDAEAAERWQTILVDGDIDALVEIGDAQLLEPGKSPLTGVFGTRPLEYVLLLTVPPVDRERAFAMLIESGWDGSGAIGGRRDGPGSASVWRTIVLVAGGILAYAGIRAIVG